MEETKEDFEESESNMILDGEIPSRDYTQRDKKETAKVNWAEGSDKAKSKVDEELAKFQNLLRKEIEKVDLNEVNAMRDEQEKPLLSKEREEVLEGIEKEEFDPEKFLKSDLLERLLKKDLYDYRKKTCASLDVMLLI